MSQRSERRSYTMTFRRDLHLYIIALQRYQASPVSIANGVRPLSYKQEYQ